MSDMIPTPGKYKQQNGKPAEVKWVGDGKALGFDSTGEEALWDAATGKQPGRVPDDFYFHITGPWIPDPPPKPFSISQHGCGVYETRDGQEATVEHKRACSMYPWGGSHPFDGKSFSNTWKDDGSHFLCTSPHDLVKYLRPLPKPAVDPGEGWRLLGNEERVENGDEYWSHSSGSFWPVAKDAPTVGLTPPQVDEKYPHKVSGYSIYRRRVTPLAPQEWTPTNELRLHRTNRADKSCPALWVIEGLNFWAVLEQKWTCGEKSEWRPIPVTTEGA